MKALNVVGKKKLFVSATTIVDSKNQKFEVFVLKSEEKEEYPSAYIIRNGASIGLGSLKRIEDIAKHHDIGELLAGLINAYKEDIVRIEGGNSPKQNLWAFCPEYVDALTGFGIERLTNVHAIWKKQKDDAREAAKVLSERREKEIEEARIEKEKLYKERLVELIKENQKISGEDLVVACKQFGIELPPVTIGFLRKKCSEINEDSYRCSSRHYPKRNPEDLYIEVRKLIKKEE